MMPNSYVTLMTGFILVGIVVCMLSEYNICLDQGGHLVGSFYWFECIRDGL